MVMQILTLPSKQPLMEGINKRMSIEYECIRKH